MHTKNDYFESLRLTNVLTEPAIAKDASEKHGLTNNYSFKHSDLHKILFEDATSDHSIYSMAFNRISSEIMELAECAGFTLIDSASTLFLKPGDEPESNLQVKTWIVLDAGFIGLLFEKGMSISLSTIDPEGDRK